jgi:hypothetical protein
MRPRPLMSYAIVRVTVIIAFLALVLLAVVPLLMPAKHVRSTDAAGLPKQQLNPHPAMRP